MDSFTVFAYFCLFLVVYLCIIYRILMYFFTSLLFMDFIPMLIDVAFTYLFCQIVNWYLVPPTQQFSATDLPLYVWLMHQQSHYYTCVLPGWEHAPRIEETKGARAWDWCIGGCYHGSRTGTFDGLRKRGVCDLGIMGQDQPCQKWVGQQIRVWSFAGCSPQPFVSLVRTGI